MRYLAGSFWTLNRDNRLQKLEARGPSAAQIDERLGTTRNAVMGRSHRLRSLIFRSEIQREQNLRALSAARRREMKHRSDAMLSAMRKGIAQGMPRKIAIIEAVEARVTYQAIGNELGLSRQRVHQIVSGE